MQRYSTTGTAVALIVTAAAAVTAYACWYMHPRRASRKTERNGESLQSGQVALDASQVFLQHSQNEGNDHIVSCVVLKPNTRLPSLAELQYVIQALQHRHKSLAAVLTLSRSHDVETKPSPTDKNHRFVISRGPPPSESDEHPPITSGVVTIFNKGNTDKEKNLSWKQVVHEQLNTVQFPNPTEDDPVRPLWKVALVHTSPAETNADQLDAPALVFTLSHLIFDGTSRNRFLREFLYCLYGPSSYAKSLRAKSLRETLPDAHDQESISNTFKHEQYQKVPSMPPLRFITCCAKLFLSDISHWWHGTQCGLTLARAPAVHDPHIRKETYQGTFSLSESETSRLLENCKRHQTTVHGAMCAAAHLALVALAHHERQQQDPPESHSRRNGWIPSQNAYFSIVHLISLWKYMDGNDTQPCDEALTGSFFTTYKIDIPIAREHEHNAWSQEPCVDGIAQPLPKSADSWKLARHIKQDLNKFEPMSSRQFVDRMLFRKAYRSFLGLNASFPMAYQTHFPSIVGPNIFISNNGAVDWASSCLDDDPNEQKNSGEPPPVVAGWEVIQAIFAATPRHHRPFGFGGLNVQTVGGQMHVGLTYYSHIWSHATAQTFLDGFKDILVRVFGCSLNYDARALR